MSAPTLVPATDSLLAGARAEVLVMSTQVTAAAKRIYRANLRRGVTYRIIAPDTSRTATTMGTLAMAGARTRTVPEVPTDAIVVDRTTVLLPTGSYAGLDGSLTPFQVPGIVTTTAELFERVWANAAPLIGTDLTDDTELDDQGRKLLALLADGHTDAVIAERLGIGVRTVRRKVAALMNQLGARSRFMAGAKAVNRGWLLERAS
jgi:DNA-binding CsgD family transcriptional regulator